MVIIICTILAFRFGSLFKFKIEVKYHNPRFLILSEYQRTRSRDSASHGIRPFVENEEPHLIQLRVNVIVSSGRGKGFEDVVHRHFCTLLQGCFGFSSHTDPFSR